MAKRRNFSVAFNAKVALEALRGDQTLAELAVAARRAGALQRLGEGLVQTRPDVRRAIEDVTADPGGGAARL